MVLLAATRLLGSSIGRAARATPEPRVFLEAQTWWAVGRTETGRRSHHVHVRRQLPAGADLAAESDGVARLDFRIVFHNMRGYLGYMFQDGIGCCDNLSPNFHIPRRRRCRDMKCTWWITRRIDTDAITHARRIRPNDRVLDGTNTGVLRVSFFVQNYPLSFLCFRVE
ncbi:hypothetical protein BH18ACT14_BH18ACT14_10490 [soil metagenome]